MATMPAEDTTIRPFEVGFPGAETPDPSCAGA